MNYDPLPHALHAMRCSSEPASDAAGTRALLLAKLEERAVHKREQQRRFTAFAFASIMGFGLSVPVAWAIARPLLASQPSTQNETATETTTQQQRSPSVSIVRTGSPSHPEARPRNTPHRTRRTAPATPVVPSVQPTTEPSAPPQEAPVVTAPAPGAIVEEIEPVSETNETTEEQVHDRYEEAVALARAMRDEEARRLLLPIAHGQHGTRWQREATLLLELLDRRQQNH